MTDNMEKKPFGKIRSMLFPIYGYECKKLIPLALIFTIITREKDLNENFENFINDVFEIFLMKDNLNEKIIIILDDFLKQKVS